MPSAYSTSSRGTAVERRLFGRRRTGCNALESVPQLGVAAGLRGARGTIKFAPLDRESKQMTDLIAKRFHWLAEQVAGGFRGRVNLCVSNVAEFPEPEIVL
jgi:hypothetical protein